MRRSAVLSLSAYAVAATLLALGSSANAQEWQTTSSLMGESKYGQNFQRYDYVNPDAPKGGTLNSVASGTFDSFNPYIVRGSRRGGSRPVRRRAALRHADGAVDRRAQRQPSADRRRLQISRRLFVGDLPASTRAPNGMTESRSPSMTSIWSFQVLKANSPMYSRYYENVTEAVALNDREVEFRFDQKGNRELPKILGDMVVLPKHWWEGTDASGKKRDITQPTLEPPLGFGRLQDRELQARARRSSGRASRTIGAPSCR